MKINEPARPPDGDIAVTGLGFFTPLGDRPDEVASALRGAGTALRDLPRGDWSTMPVRRGGFIAPERLAPYRLDPFKFKGFKHYIHFGVAATGNALAMAGLAPSPDRPVPDDRLGAFVATGINGENVEGLFEGLALSAAPDGSFDPARFAAEGIDTVHPKWILTAISNNLIFFLTSEFGLRGDGNNAAYCAAGGAYMLDAAVASLRAGACDAAVVTGSDSLLNWQCIDDLAKAGLLGNAAGTPPEAMPAYTAEASGALPAEGAACLVLERAADASRRGARILARIAAVETWSENRPEPEPEPSGEAPARVLAALAAHLPAAARDLLVLLDGASAPAWDAAELAGAEPVLDRLAATGRRIRLAAVKPRTGHAFSAAFVLDTAIAALALSRTLDLRLPHAVPGDDRFATPAPSRWDACIVHGRGLFGNAGGALLLHA